jgi:hypothetical protein
MALPMEIDMALALCPRYGGRLGDALVGLGVLRPVELFRALVAQTQERFIDLLCWRYGQLEFIHDLRAEGETILQGASPLELIAQGVLQGYPDIELEDVLGAFLAQDVRPVVTLDQTVAQLKLTGREGAALLILDRPMTTDALVETCAVAGIAGRGEVLRAVVLGLSARSSVTSGWPPAIQRPSVPTMKM